MDDLFVRLSVFPDPNCRCCQFLMGYNFFCSFAKSIISTTSNVYYNTNKNINDNEDQKTK